LIALLFYKNDRNIIDEHIRKGGLNTIYDIADHVIRMLDYSKNFMYKEGFLQESIQKITEKKIGISSNYAYFIARIAMQKNKTRNVKLYSVYMIPVFFKNFRGSYETKYLVVLKNNIINEAILIDSKVYIKVRSSEEIFNYIKKMYDNPAYACLKNLVVPCSINSIFKNRRRDIY
jgi:hypothetical protein